MRADPLLTARAPLEREHPSTWALLRLEQIHQPSPERDRMFASAMREIASWHYARNSVYRAWCEAHAFSPVQQSTDAESLERLPALSAAVFKEKDLSTEHRVTRFEVSSSGTGGSATRLPLDLESVMRMWAMGRASLEEEALFSDRAVDYVVLAPDPRSHSGHGNAQFFSALMRAAPARAVCYGLGSERGALTLERERTSEHLRRCAAAQRQVRLLGLPALLSRLAQEFLEEPVRLPTGSLVLTGAGWKREADAAIPKPAFRALMARAFGVADECVRDLYGMTEHAVHYVECREHRFHAPVFARVLVVDPLSREPVAPGETGLLQLQSPGITTLPVHSLLTSDVGRFVPCPCPRATPAFEVTGRGGTTRHRGCAVSTLERLIP